MIVLLCYCFITGQFGSPGIHVGALVTFLLSTISSIIDSVGDYYACAKMVLAPPPPKHAINRGIAIEGMMSLIGGSAGTSHATSTFASNIGAMGITRVLSHINLLHSPSRFFTNFFDFTKIVYSSLSSMNICLACELTSQSKAIVSLNITTLSWASLDEVVNHHSIYILLFLN